jgi:hypothetical protein
MAAEAVPQCETPCFLLPVWARVQKRWIRELCTTFLVTIQDSLGAIPEVSVYIWTLMITPLFPISVHSYGWVVTQGGQECESTLVMGQQEHKKTHFEFHHWDAWQQTRCVSVAHSANIKQTNPRLWILFQLWLPRHICTLKHFDTISLLENFFWRIQLLHLFLLASTYRHRFCL